MTTALILFYLSDIASAVNFWLFVTLSLICVAIIFLVSTILEKKDDINKGYLKSWLKRLIFAFSLISLVCMFFPSREFFLVLSGIKAGEVIINNEKINPLIDKSYKIIDNKLNEFLKESEK